MAASSARKGRLRHVFAAAALSLLQACTGSAGGGRTALVAEVSGRTVTINAGADAGVKAGDRLAVERPGRTLTDPATNRVLRVEMQRLGTLVLTKVEPNYAIAAFTPAGPANKEEPRRGDVVKLEN